MRLHRLQLVSTVASIGTAIQTRTSGSENVGTVEQSAESDTSIEEWLFLPPHSMRLRLTKPPQYCIVFGRGFEERMKLGSASTKHRVAGCRPFRKSIEEYRKDRHRWQRRSSRNIEETDNAGDREARKEERRGRVFVTAVGFWISKC